LSAGVFLTTFFSIAVFLSGLTNLILPEIPKSSSY
jgi:hypothetical protein